MSRPVPAVRHCLAALLRGRPGRGRLRGDRGAGSAEIVVAVPLLMLLILLVIQFAIWENAESIAHATAEEALAAARVQGGTAASGQQRASQVIGQIGSGVLDGPSVSVAMTPADVTVRVDGTAERVLPVPGFSFPVTATVTGPVERFVPDSRGFSNSEGLSAVSLRVVAPGG